jgi:hypothetical protein
MSNRPNFSSRVPVRPGGVDRARHTRRARRGLSLAAGAAVIVALVALALTGGGDGGAPADRAAKETPARTGEVNDMGLPVVETPGAPAGTATAGGVEVAGATWDLGRVPLNVAVRPTWTLRNTSGSPVTLGAPKAEVRKGCCPGPLTLEARSLAPGASTTLTFELSMHSGMDGPHDLGVHVPVQGVAGADHLTLGVTGDFR